MQTRVYDYHVDLEDFGYTPHSFVATTTVGDIHKVLYKKEIREALTDEKLYTIVCEDYTGIGDGARYTFTATFTKPNGKEFVVSVNDAYFSGDVINRVSEVDNFFDTIYDLKLSGN